MVEFDDGDRGWISLSNVRFLPLGYQIQCRSHFVFYSFTSLDILISSVLKSSELPMPAVYTGSILPCNEDKHWHVLNKGSLNKDSTSRVNQSTHHII